MNLCAYVLQNLAFSVFPRKPSRYQNVKLMNLTWRYYMRICGKSSCNWRQFQHHSTLITSYIEHCFEIKSTFKGTTLDTQLCRHLIYNQWELNIQPFSKNLNFELEIVNTFEYLFFYQNTGCPGNSLKLLIIFPKSITTTDPPPLKGFLKQLSFCNLNWLLVLMF